MELNGKNVKKIIFIIAVAVLMIWAMVNYETIIKVVFSIVGLLNPLIMGFAIAFILNVFVRVLEDHVYKPLDKKGNRFWRAARRPLSVILSISFITGVLVIIVTMIVPEVEKAGKMLIVQFPEYWANLQLMLNNLTTRFGVDAITLPALSISWEQIQEMLEKFIKSDVSGQVIDTALIAATSIFSKAFNMLIGLVFAIYMLLKKETLGRQAKQIVYAYFPKAFADEALYIGRLSNRIFSKFVTGQCTEAVIIGLLCFIGMAVMRLPYAPMISVLVGFSALIPVFGAFIGTAVGAFLILMISPIQALWFVIFIIILQQVEGNLIYPKIVGSSIGLPAIWVMLAVIVGAATGGIMGMLVSVPLSSVAYSMIGRSVRRRLGKKEINVETL